MQNKVRVLVITTALIMTLVIGACAGIAYQKEQPVDVVVTWYNATEDTASFDAYPMTMHGDITIVPDRNITYYNIMIRSEKES